MYSDQLAEVPVNSPVSPGSAGCPCRRGLGRVRITAPTGPDVVYMTVSKGILLLDACSPRTGNKTAFGKLEKVILSG